MSVAKRTYGHDHRGYHQGNHTDKARLGQVRLRTEVRLRLDKIRIRTEVR